MIDVTTTEQRRQLEEQTDQDLYEALREHIGSTVLVRRRIIERVGTLEWLTFDRMDQTQDKIIRYKLGEQADHLNVKHQVKVKIDGVWKILSLGTSVNREL